MTDRPRRVFLSHTGELRRFPMDGSYIASAQEAVVRAGHAVTDMANAGLCASKVRVLRGGEPKDSDEDRAILAGALMDLAAAKDELGDHVAAAKATGDAVDICRQLVAHDRATHLPDLATSLYNLAKRLGETGHHTDALSTPREAAKLFREAQQMHGDVYASDVSLAERLVNSLTDSKDEADDPPRPSDL